jgi:urease accessory protein
LLIARLAHASGSWDRAVERGSVTLAFDERHRRRWRMTTDAGEALLLDLPQAAHLRHGDGLELESGGVVRVIARPEPVLEIRAGTAGLARLAYHLGNRHLAMQIFDDHLLVRDDHVIAEMVRGLGGDVTLCDLAFDPEPGAYGGAGRHEHAHHD